jgi:hypothetical protein
VTIARADFNTLCRLQGFAMTAEEAERLFEAYQKLRVLLDRIPGDAGEPAVVLANPGARLVR